VAVVPAPRPGDAQSRGDQAGLRRDWLAPFPLDIRLVLGVHRRGSGDPAFRYDPDGSVWRTSLTPQGPVTLRVSARPAEATRPPAAARPSDATRPSGATGPSGATARHRDPAAGTWVTALAWGPGACWQLTALPDLLGASDDPASFQPAHPLVRAAVAHHPGARLGRSGRIWEALVPAVLEQKVVSLEAFRAWRLLLRRFGLPAPGPAPRGLRVCPPAATWAAIPSWEWHRAGVEGVRAATIRGAARVAGRLEQIVTLPMAEADRRLRSLPGIGPWTSAHIRQRACGDPDAIAVGDYNLPGAIGWALTRRIVDDTGMLQLLAPYPGHRHRAAELILLSGPRPPRHGPRNPVRDYRAI
jgi:3-methyladenine DNA glycosylase/8-oxoguanine DNA glycosylase